VHIIAAIARACADADSAVLQVVVDVMEPGKLVLYPQILLACTALLGMSYVHLWRLLLELLSKVRLKSC